MMRISEQGIGFACLPVSTVTPGMLSSLHPLQRADVEACGSDKRRTERALVYRLLGLHHSEPFLIGHNPDGSPYLTTIHGDRYDGHFSLTHSRRYVGIATAPFPVGIDIEDPSDKIDRVKDKFLSADEQSFIDTPYRRLMAWTIKEAVYKAALTPGLSLTPGIKILSCVCGQAQVSVEDSRMFTAESMELTDGSVLTLACRQSPRDDQAAVPGLTL